MSPVQHGNDEQLSGNRPRRHVQLASLAKPVRRLSIDVARGALVHGHPQGGEKTWPNLQGKVVSAPPGRTKVHFLGNWGRSGRTVGVVNLVVLACVLRATTKNVVNFSGEEKMLAKKMLATPMRLS